MHMGTAHFLNDNTTNRWPRLACSCLLAIDKGLQPPSRTPVYQYRTRHPQTHLCTSSSPLVAIPGHERSELHPTLHPVCRVCHLESLAPHFRRTSMRSSAKLVQLPRSGVGTGTSPAVVPYATSSKGISRRRNRRFRRRRSGGYCWCLVVLRHQTRRNGETYVKTAGAGEPTWLRSGSTKKSRQYSPGRLQNFWVHGWTPDWSTSRSRSVKLEDIITNRATPAFGISALVLKVLKLA
ncbi:hypothetical protein C8F01DRAFT_43099 [Mycena amicta]|nr:hypothetical protein C8F01DRAFT_43099 [Mycena amicta]